MQEGAPRSGSGSDHASLLNLGPSTASRGGAVLRTLAPIISLVYWAMLSASTIGPGTITLMAKGGADYGLYLAWTVPLASSTAYVVYEAVARLQIEANRSLGGALFSHYAKPLKDTPASEALEPIKIHRIVGAAKGTPTISFLVASLIVISMTLLECAQIAGMWAAVDYYYSSPEPMYSICKALVTAGLCLLVTLILFSGEIDGISKALGLIVLVMVVTFGISAAQIGVDSTALFRGFEPTLPTGSATVALGMIATTCLPINVFLTSSLAQGLPLPETRRGIGFSTIVTAILSLLIVIVGTGDDLENGEDFDLNNLARTLKESAGSTCEALFLFGLGAASLSSGLTVAMGAALACQSLLSGLDDPEAHKSSSARAPGQDEDILRGSITEHMSQRDESHADEDALLDLLPKKEPWAASGWRFRALIIFQLLASFLVVMSGLNTIGVIVLSQVFGGVLLPTLCFCLLICMNDKEIGVIQSRTQNSLLLVACTILTGLAVYSVLGGICGGTTLVVLSSLAALATFVAGLAVVIKGEDRGSSITEWEPGDLAQAQA